MSGSESDRNRGGPPRLPQWDGRFETYEKYCDRCRIHKMGMKYDERNLLPAQHAGALKDKARQMFYDLEPKKQEKILEQGLDHYLKAIKDVVLEGAVLEASRYFSEYFQEFSRNKGEGMKSYCTRHNRVLGRLEAALKGLRTEDLAVEPDQRKGPGETGDQVARTTGPDHRG